MRERGVGLGSRDEPLARDALRGGAAEVAPGLIGCRVVRVVDGRRLSGTIIETEAYVGVHDRASHAFGGRRTARNESMYAAAGAAYVYFTYGMHHCFNVVCGEEGDPQAVLVRAILPQEGLEFMRARRRAGAADRDLCSGPGKLCQAMGIDRTLNAVDLCSDPGLFLAAQPPGWRAARVVRCARIGLGDVGGWKDRRLRWLIAGSPFVSAAPRGGNRARP